MSKVRPLRMGPSKAPQKCFGFFQAAQFEFLRELLETPYLKISYPKNIWFFTVTKKKKKGVLLIQCKTW